MLLKSNIFPVSFIAALAVLFIVNSCTEKPAPLPSATVPLSRDTTGVQDEINTALLLVQDHNIQASYKYAEKAITRLLDAGMDTLAARQAYAFADNTWASDTAGIADSLLNYTITRLVKNQKTLGQAGGLFAMEGYILQERGRFTEANKVYLDAMRLLPQQQYAYRWALMLTNIAQNYNSIGDYKESILFADRALQIIAQHPESFSADKIKEQTYKSLYAIGWANYEQQHTAAALLSFRKAYSLADEDQQCSILNFISKCYLDAGQTDSAFMLVQQALQRYKKINGNDIFVDGIHQLARYHFKTGNLTTALRLFNTELPAAIDEHGPRHPDVVKIMVYIGRIYEQQHAPEQALSAFQEAINMSFYHQLPEGRLANPKAEQLFADYWLLDAFYGKSRCLDTLFCLKNPKGDLNLALESAILASEVKSRLVDVFNTETAKSEIASSSRPLYELGIRQALMLGDSIRAYQLVQHAKANILREKMAKDHAFAILPDSLVAARQTLQLAIKKFKMNDTSGKTHKPVEGLLTLEVQLQMLEDKIRKLSPAFAALEKTLAPMEMDTIRAHLPEDAAMLDFFCGGQTVYLFALSKKGLHIYQTAASKTYAAEVAQLRTAVLQEINNQTESAFLSSARSCYQNLLEAPLRDLSRADPGIKRLWIVSDDILHYLPFDVLLTADIPAFQNKNMPYLIRKYAIGYAFTAQQFFQQHPLKQDLMHYTGWGIRYDSLALQQINQGKKGQHTMRNYGTLPKARLEIEAVQQLLGGSAWLDTAANKSCFLTHATQSRICHLAMHAIPNDAAPQESVLVFSPGDSTQYLSVAEIAALPLKADLVVLSACNTAKGALLPGEGLSSLGRAFEYAGARSVLMTQWNTEDNAAYTIIPAFFSGIKAGKSKDIALQEAKLAMLDKPSFFAFQAPLYWAGMIVSGDMKPIPVNQRNMAFWGWILAGLAGAFGLWRVVKKRG